MPASADMDLGSRVVSFTAGGALIGGFFGLGVAAVNQPAVAGGSGMQFAGKLASQNAGKLAAVAGVFAGTDTLLTQTRGHSVANQAAAGCAAGATLGFMNGGGPQAAAPLCVLFGVMQLAGGLGTRDMGH